MPIRIVLILTILTLFNPSLSLAATERRTALVIGNSAYSSGPLRNPVNDATAITAMLKQLGFTVILKKNAGQQDMDDAIREFGRQLKRNRGVGLFYYAGHGMQIGGVNYLLPVNARIEKESDVRFNALNADMVLAEMENAENGVNIVILDACRDNPFSRGFRNVARGLAIISNAPSGTFISYSTGLNQVARDGEGKNSPYTKALLENMGKPGLTINNVFMKVRSKVKKETGQVPWELSSLEGDFYFVPVKGKTVTDSEESSVSTKAATHDLDENPKMESLQRLAEDQKKVTAEELKKKFEERKAQIGTVEDELKKLKLQIEVGWKNKEDMKQKEDEHQQKFKAYKKLVKDANDELAMMESNLDTEKIGATLAMSKPPTAPPLTETGRDGRFIAYADGTVLDTRTNLMWAAKDNGSDIYWRNAKSYCENYRGGGYTDWRMPTLDELAGLYDRNKSFRATQRDYNVHLTELIQLSAGCPWASEINGSEAAYLNFLNGTGGWFSQQYDPDALRALPVRSAK